MGRDLPAEPLDRLALTRPRSRQPHVGGLDAEPVHQVKDFEFQLDRWVGHRRALKAIAQSLVVEGDGPSRASEAVWTCFRPIEYEVLFRWNAHKRTLYVELKATAG